MKILIVGAGEIGRHLASHLSAEAHDITIIDQNAQLIEEWGSTVDARVIEGDGCSITQLIEAGAPEADLFFGLTENDNANLVSASIAKKLGTKRVICRTHPRVQREEWIFDHRDHFGIDHIFTSERLAAAELSNRIHSRDSLHVEEIARGKIEFQQILMESNSAGVGKSLAQLKLPARLRIASVSRGDEHFVPDAETVLRRGDILSIFGESHKLRNLVKTLGSQIKDEPLKVVIFGGGEYAYALAQTLKGWNCKIRIFEKDPDRADHLSRELEDVTIINEDATSLQALKEEQVGSADFFVATSSSDEDNVMTCLQAHSLGVESCLTLFHRADYANAITDSAAHFGIESAVSPREAARRELMSFVTSDRYHVVRKLDAGELIEAAVPEKSPLAGKKVIDIDWPKGSVLVAIVHGIRAYVPAAEDEIVEGDNIFALVAPEAKKRFLKLLK